MNVVKDIPIPLDDWIVSEVTYIMRKKTLECFPEKDCIQLALLDWLTIEAQLNKK